MIAVPVVSAAIVGVVLLLLSVTNGSAAGYAKSHVQALFVTERGRPTATVRACRRVGTGNGPTTGVWACTISGKECTRVFRFAVDREYGTVPNDSPSFAAVDAGPCETH